MGNVIIILLDEIQFHELKTYVTASFDWRIIWDKKSTQKKENSHICGFSTDSVPKGLKEVP